MISIVMAACQAEAHIARAVASLQTQGVAEWELLIGVDDDTDYLALLAAAGHSPAHHGQIRQKATGRVRSGPSAARNAALSLAEGEIIAVLDADDWFAPGRLAELAPLAARHGVVVDRMAVVHDPAGPGGGAVIGHAFAPFCGLGRVSAAAMLACGVPLLPVARREVIGEGWAEGVRFSEDSLFNLQLLERNHGLMAIHPRPSYHYCVRAGSLAHGQDASAPAEAGYDVLLDGLATHGYGLGEPLRAAALAGYRAKRAYNQRFGAVAARGESFQEFRARDLPLLSVLPY